MDEKKQKIVGLAMTLPSFLAILLFIAYPIVQTVVTSFQDKNGRWTMGNYIRIFYDGVTVTNIIYTLEIVLVTVLLSCAVSLPFGVYLTYGKGRIASIIKKLYIIPQFIPGIVAVYATINIIKDTGAISRFLLLFGIHFTPGLMYTAQGIILMNLWFNIPFTTMIISSAIVGIPVAILDSARDVGAGRLRILSKMILPLCYKSVLLAAVMVYMGNVGAYTTPSLIGSNAPRMLGVQLYQEFGAFYDIPYSSALSVFMFLICSFGGVIYIRSELRKGAQNAKG